VPGTQTILNIALWESTQCKPQQTALAMVAAYIGVPVTQTI